jgi:hypothetical protein
MHTKFLFETLTEETTRERYIYIDEMITLKQILMKNMDMIHMANDSVQWVALVNTVMNLRVS